MFSDFHRYIRDLFAYSLRSLKISIIDTLKSLSCASAILHFSETTAKGLQVSGGGILSWMVMFMFSFSGI